MFFCIGPKSVLGVKIEITP